MNTLVILAKDGGYRLQQAALGFSVKVMKLFFKSELTTNADAENLQYHLGPNKDEIISSLLHFLSS